MRSKMKSRQRSKYDVRRSEANVCHKKRLGNKNSATGTRTRVARVRAEYPNQLDYSGECQAPEPLQEPFEFRTTAILFPIIQEL
jgi:hypothetical protein